MTPTAAKPSSRPVAPRAQSATRRLFGVIVRINKKLGYGFIRPDDGSADRYLHVGAMRDRAAFREQQRVSFLSAPTAHRGKAAPALDVAAEGPEGLPSAADLDADAEERRIRRATTLSEGESHGRNA